MATFFQAGLKLMALIYHCPGLIITLLYWMPQKLLLITNLGEKGWGQWFREQKLQRGCTLWRCDQDLVVCGLCPDSPPAFQPIHSSWSCSVSSISSLSLLSGVAPGAAGCHGRGQFLCELCLSCAPGDLHAQGSTCSCS